MFIQLRVFHPKYSTKAQSRSKNEVQKVLWQLNFSTLLIEDNVYSSFSLQTLRLYNHKFNSLKEYSIYDCGLVKITFFNQNVCCIMILIQKKLIQLQRQIQQ